LSVHRRRSPLPRDGLLRWRRGVPPQRLRAIALRSIGGEVTTAGQRLDHSPRRGLVLTCRIEAGYPMLMAMMATARSPKAVPISPIRPWRRRSCIKPREVLPLETISKIPRVGLKAVASACRLVLTAKFLRWDARPRNSERTDHKRQR